MKTNNIITELAVSTLSVLLSNTPAFADARQETLLIVNEFGPNSLDIHGVGTNRPGYGVAWNCYDRLMTYGKRTLADGTASYDFKKLEPELAESWHVAPDAMSVTLMLASVGRQRALSEARSAIGWLAQQCEQFTLTEVAKRLGRDVTTLRRRVWQLGLKAQTSKTLSQRLEMFNNAITQACPHLRSPLP